MVKPPICIHWYRGWSGPVAHPAAMSSARAVVAMGGLTKINEIWWGYHGVSVQSCSMLSRISVYIHTVIYTFFVPISISIYIYKCVCVCVIWVCRKLGDAFKIASCCSRSNLFHLHSSKITVSFFLICLSAIVAVVHHPNMFAVARPRVADRFVASSDERWS